MTIRDIKALYNNQDLIKRIAMEPLGFNSRRRRKRMFEKLDDVIKTIGEEETAFLNRHEIVTIEGRFEIPEKVRPDWDNLMNQEIEDWDVAKIEFPDIPLRDWEAEILEPFLDFKVTD